MESKRLNMVNQALHSLNSPESLVTIVPVIVYIHPDGTHFSSFNRPCFFSPDLKPSSAGQFLCKVLA